jgi:hypothetical protein
MFEKRVLRKMFGPQSVEVTRNWRKLHNDELHDLHPPPPKSNIITVITSERMRWPGHVTRPGENRNVHRLLAGKRKRKWENGTKTYLKGTGRDGVSWINLAGDRDKSRADVNMVMNSRVPLNAGTSSPAEELVAFQESLCSLDLV